MADGPKAIRDYTAPAAYSAPSCIVLTPSIGAYEIKTSILNALQSFYGLSKKNPYHHIRDFIELCEMQRFNNITTDQQRLRLFPYSLKYNAKAWLQALPGTRSQHGMRCRRLSYQSTIPRKGLTRSERR